MLGAHSNIVTYEFAHSNKNKCHAKFKNDYPEYIAFIKLSSHKNLYLDANFRPSSISVDRFPE